MSRDCLRRILRNFDVCYKYEAYRELNIAILFNDCNQLGLMWLLGEEKQPLNL